MFVNKINGVSNLGFKGYQHVKNNVGQTVMKFNYVYDYDKEDCEVQFFKVKRDDNYDYNVIESPIASVKLNQDGVDVDLQKITNLGKEEAFAYKIVRKDKSTGKVLWEGADTGMKIYGDKYSLVSRLGTTPMVNGAGYLALLDSMVPGARFRGFKEENTGEIVYDKDYQKKMEGEIRNFSNVYGGNMAGLQMKLPYLQENGVKVLFTLPMTNGDSISSHGYWNEDNMQIASRMGTTENFSSLMKDMYKRGMVYVLDGTFTSGSLMDKQFQYALRWAEKNPQFYYCYRMSGLKNSSLGLGVIPKNEENLRFRLVNAPYNFELQGDGTYKKVANPNYKSNRPTSVQIYDAKQASERQIKDYDNAMGNYEKLIEGNFLGINSHDDTLINYIFPVRDFKEIEDRINVINDLNKKQGKNIKLDSSEGTIMTLQLSNFRIDKKTEGGFVTWDANSDMAKRNYGISGYDEKLLQAIPDRAQREYEKQMIERGAYEVQDMAIQAGVLWAGRVKDYQTEYTAQTIGSAKTVNAINKLVEEKKLPQEAKVTDEVLANILNGQYILEPKGILDKDSVTVKSLMKMPVEAVEFDKYTSGILSTSYFSNRATNEETLGVSRFDLMKQNNPHLVEPYSKTYNKMNNMFNNEIKDFANSIIKIVDKNSSEKLLDKNGDYTEYGEYVMELVGQDITKYALLKSLSGDSFKTKILNSGEITYDYDAIKENTSIEALGLKAHNPEDEAAQLANKIQKGLKQLSSSDIDFVAKSINQRIAGTDTSSFRISEALVDRSGLGLSWRLDAAKDVMDQDAVRNEDSSFDDIQTQGIKFWKKWVECVKPLNPHAKFIAEITDIEYLMKDTYGENFRAWYDRNLEQNSIGQKFLSDPDFMAKFFNETGLTTETAYSYTFTDLLKVFSKEFESGKGYSDTHNSFKDRVDFLLRNKNIDYIRNMYTLMGNHDKPRMLHGLAIDMSLFHSKLLNGHNKEDFEDFSQEHDQRMDVIRIMSGAKTMADVPIELRLNADNNDYFKTISSRAVAQSKLLMDSVYEDLDGIATEDDKKLILDALVDLANGNYLGQGVTDKMTKIKIKELSSLENAFEAILKMAESHGLSLTEAERQELIRNVVAKANSMDLNGYFVHGDFGWTSLSDNDKKNNAEHAKDILGDSFSASKHSLYSIQLAKLLKDAYLKTGKNTNAKDAIFAGMKDFAQKYDRNMINSNREEFKHVESYNDAMRKNGYAARDIRTAMTMAIKQAEFKSGKKISNKETILDTVYKSVTEPAIVKGAMIMEYLKALSGTPTIYAGDEMGMTGYEEKAKNIYLQNRNALPWTELEEKNMIGNYRKTIVESMFGTLKDRINPELHSLNDGTPYALDVQTNFGNREALYKRRDEIQEEIKKLGNSNPKLKEKLEGEFRELGKELAKVAYLMQSTNGDMTVSLFNAGDIEHGNRVDYFAKYNLDTEAKRKKFFEDNNIDSINPNNKYIPIQPKSEVDMILLGAGVAIPVGTVFTNANARDKAKYVVKEIGGKLGIVKEGGGKIVMDGMTSKNGVMILKHIKNIIFKGGQKKRTYFNPQYNIVSNPYKKSETVEEGQKLSIVAR